MSDHVPPVEGTVARGMAEAALAVLLHRMNNAAQRMAALKALIELDPSGSMLVQRAGELADTSRTLDDLGWLVGLVARALSADVLGERRERAGLAPLVSVVAEALRKSGIRLGEPRQRLPDVGTAQAHGPDSAWAAMAALWSAATESSGEELEWAIAPTGDGHALRVAGQAGSLVHDTVRQVEATIPRARFAQHASSWTLSFPRGAFEGP